MSELLKPYLAWLHLHPHWAGIATFLIAFTESLAVIGLLIPGTVIMTALGVLIGADVLSFTSIVFWLIVGAITGDILSFWLGYYYQQHIRERWPFRHYPQLLTKGEIFFRKHGGKGVFLGRYLGPMRPIIPLIAGMMSMRPLRFILVDTTSGIIWAPLMMLPGILIGAASQELPPELATRLLLFIVLILLIFWCVSWLVKKIYRLIQVKINQLLAQWWNWVHRDPHLYKIELFLRDPRQPADHGQFGLSLLFLLCSGLFIWLVSSVIQHGLLTAWNLPAYYLMRSLRSTLVDQVMVLITFLGEAPVLACMWLAVLVWLLLKRYWRAAVHWLLAGLVWLMAVEGLKYLVHSARPLGLFRAPAGWSFPSGHAVGGSLLLGYLAVLLSYGRKRLWQWLAAAIAGISVIAIVISRLYLGAHWLTDVIGGVLIGLAGLCFLTVSFRRKLAQPLAPAGVLLVTIISLLLAWGWYFQKSYLTALHDYTPYWQKYTINARQWWEQANKAEPLYRYNRFGKPIQVINLQWAGKLKSIEQNLSAQGWHKESRRTLVILLSGLVSKDNKKQLPVLSQLYEDHRSVLILTKYLDQENKLLVLRLWDANLKIDTGLPLWYGTIGYYRWRRHYFLPRYNEQLADENTNLVPATQVLINDLNGFHWKQVYYQQVPANIIATDPNWNRYVLFVMP